MRKAIGSVIGTLMMAAALAASQTRPQDIRLQAAIRLETVDGNLPDAMCRKKLSASSKPYVRSAAGGSAR